MGYPQDLRNSIVKRLLSEEINYEEAAQEYGVSKQSMYHWVSEARKRLGLSVEEPLIITKCLPTSHYPMASALQKCTTPMCFVSILVLIVRKPVKFAVEKVS